MDPELVRRAQNGDHQAFEALTVADYPRLYRVANGVLGDRHLAEDATQQAFVTIWRDFPRLRDASKYEGWSYRLLVRVCYSEVRRRSVGLTPRGEPSDVGARAADPYGVIADRDQLERGFRQLSLDHRVVLVMRYLLGMTPEQVSDTLGVPRWTVYSRLERAVKAMRAALEAADRPVSPTVQRQGYHR